MVAEKVEAAFDLADEYLEIEFIESFVIQEWWGVG
jgi:hypothetical protein